MTMLGYVGIEGFKGLESKRSGSEVEKTLRYLNRQEFQADNSDFFQAIRTGLE